MGNNKSVAETAGVKAQAEGRSLAIYNLLDLKGKLEYVGIFKSYTVYFTGGGYLLEEMKRAITTQNFDPLNDALKTKVKPFLYNGGKGRKVSVAEMVALRNLERPSKLVLPSFTSFFVVFYIIASNLSWTATEKSRIRNSPDSRNTSLISLSECRFKKENTERFAGT